ncbi:MAG: hypothetical protein ABSG48_10530 [Geobacteraceae bacterium]
MSGTLSGSKSSRGRDPVPGRQGTTPREAQNPDGWPQKQEISCLSRIPRAIPQSALQKKIRDLTEEETAELELATDEALGRVEPQPK